MSNTNVQESMRKPCRYSQLIKTCILYYKSHENLYQILQSHDLYQVLQVTCAMPEHAMSSYDKIIITIVPSYTEKNITRLLPLALLLVLHTHNNTDSNKLVYYGDTYIVSPQGTCIYLNIVVRILMQPILSTYTSSEF